MRSAWSPRNCRARLAVAARHSLRTGSRRCEPAGSGSERLGRSSIGSSSPHPGADTPRLRPSPVARARLDAKVELGVAGEVCRELGVDTLVLAVEILVDFAGRACGRSNRAEPLEISLAGQRRNETGGCSFQSAN